MVSLSWIDIHYLTQEFNSKLQGAKIENIYGNHEELHIKLYKLGQKNLFLSTFLSSGVIVINNTKYQHNSKNIFIQFLRKYLKNSTLERCISYIKERIITLEFTTKNLETKEFETHYLHIELFMGGQIYLCDSQNTILKKLKHFNNSNSNESSKSSSNNNHNSNSTLSSSNNESSSNKYKLPNKNLNLLHINTSDLDTSKSLQESIKFLGLGKKYVEYLAIMLFISPQTQLSELNNEKINRLREIVAHLLDFSIDPSSIDEKNTLLPFNPNELHPKIISELNLHISELERSYSHELIKLYGSSFIPKTNERKEPAKLTKLKKRLSEQEKNLSKIKTQSEKFEQQAGSFYEHYQELQQLQQKINEIIKNEGFKTLKTKIKDNETLNTIISSVDEKNKTVSINTQALEELKK